MGTAWSVWHFSGQGYWDDYHSSYLNIRKGGLRRLARAEARQAREGPPRVLLLFVIVLLRTSSSITTTTTTTTTTRSINVTSNT